MYNYQMTWTAIGAIAGSATGIAALLLSILNYRRAHLPRVIVDLTPLQKKGDKVVALADTAFHTLLPIAISVRNESSFQVIISEVGIRVTQPQRTTLVPEQAQTIDGTPLPYVLSARCSCLIPIGTQDGWDLSARDVETVFARIDTGKEFRISRRRLATARVVGKAIREVRSVNRREIAS